MVLKSDPDTVIIKARDDEVFKAEAAGTVTPGDAIEVSGEQTSGAKALDQVQRQSTDAEGGAAFLVAIEQRGQGGRGKDDDYSSGDLVDYVRPLPGDELDCFHNTAEDISFGDKLVLSGDGTLRGLNTAGGDVDADVVAEAKGAVSNSTGTAKTRMHIRVI